MLSNRASKQHKNCILLCFQAAITQAAIMVSCSFFNFWRYCNSTSWIMKKAHVTFFTWSCKITWQTKSIVSLLMTTKLDSLATYLYKLISVKSHDPLFLWSCEIIWQITNISPQPQYLGPTELAGWFPTMRKFH